MGAYEKGLVSGPTVVLSDRDAYDPEFALLRPEALGRRPQMPYGRRTGTIGIVT